MKPILDETEEEEKPERLENIEDLLRAYKDMNQRIKEFSSSMEVVSNNLDNIKNEIVEVGKRYEFISLLAEEIVRMVREGRKPKDKEGE
jgi:hypothetical protein